MKIAIVGGTGGLGEGLAKRFSLKHEVVVGSRDKDKAQRAASQFHEDVARLGHSVSIQGSDNGSAVSDAQVTILAVPHDFALSTVEALKNNLSKDSVLVCPVVPMTKTKYGFSYIPPNEQDVGSMAEAVAKISPVPVVAAFHTLPARRLADVSKPLDLDVPVCGDDQSALQVVTKLISETPNLRPLLVGGVASSRLVESVTPLILNISVRNKLRDLAIKFV
ncbi:MAG: NADPH-dependent F420 reductase [Thermoprotei archaeon]